MTAPTQDEVRAVVRGAEEGQRCPECGLLHCVCHLDDDDQPEPEYDPGEDCGRWINGSLGRLCTSAGTEFCDWECPYS
jgi:hypothetical protein